MHTQLFAKFILYTLIWNFEGSVHAGVMERVTESWNYCERVLTSGFKNTQSSKIILDIATLTGEDQTNLLGAGLLYFMPEPEGEFLWTQPIEVVGQEGENFIRIYHRDIGVGVILTHNINYPHAWLTRYVPEGFKTIGGTRYLKNELTGTFERYDTTSGSGVKTEDDHFTVIFGHQPKSTSITHH